MYLRWADLNLIVVIEDWTTDDHKLVGAGITPAVAFTGGAEMPQGSAPSVRLVAPDSRAEVPQDRLRGSGDGGYLARIPHERGKRIALRISHTVVPEIRIHLGRESGGDGNKRESTESVAVSGNRTA